MGTTPIRRVTWFCYGPEIWYIPCSTKEGRIPAAGLARCHCERICFICSIPFLCVGVHGARYWPGGSFLDWGYVSQDCLNPILGYNVFPFNRSPAGDIFLD